MTAIEKYLNPIARLGQRNYSISFPIAAVSITALLIEIYALQIVGEPEAAGLPAIVLLLAEIIYFSFRDGLRGGIAATLLTLLYYIYIVTSRGSGEEPAQWVTIAVLGGLYLFLAGTIGWLKQTIDYLIEKEADGKRRLQAIVQQLPIGVMVLDSQGTIEILNKELLNILGKRLHVGQRINEVEITGNSMQLLKSFGGNKSYSKKEFVVDAGRGKKTYLDVGTAVIRNRKGEVFATATIVDNITQQKETEKRKDDFVNMASHELKTPITSMKLYIELLMKKARKDGDETLQKTLINIKSQSDRLQELVSDLLDVSRLQTRKLSFNKEKFRLSDLIEETIEELRGSTKQQEIIYTKGNNPEVYADKFRIYQVVTNLITNAIKYSPEKTEIKVVVKNDRGKAVVSVSDRGIGINKEQHKKIFDRLYQVTDSKEKTFPGLGMGLYISREIIKKHKGNIWVRSEKGKGSTFYFSLPLHKTF